MEKGSSNIGVAAHITAAAAGGPRYDASMSSEARRAAPNAIWLCARCARLIDNDVVTFTVSELERWNVEAVARAHEALVTGALLTGPTPESVLHDKEKFAKSDRHMDERDLRLLVSQLSPDGNDTWMSKADSWCWYFATEGNQYMQPALRDLCESLRTELLWVLHHHRQLFMKESVPEVKPDQFAVALLQLLTRKLVRRPEVPADQFAGLWAQLSARATRSLDAYVVYRRAVKHALAI